MTKKHFKALAEAMKNIKPDESWLERSRQWENDLCTIAQVAEQFNPLFNRDRFYEAAGFQR